MREQQGNNEKKCKKVLMKKAQIEYRIGKKFKAPETEDGKNENP